VKRWLWGSLIFAALAAGATLVFGWLGLVLGVAWGWTRGVGTLKGPLLEGSAGAVLGWAGLLIWDSVDGRLGVLARELGGLLHAPGWVPVAVTMAFAGLLGGSAAALGATLARPASERAT